MTSPSMRDVFARHALHVLAAIVLLALTMAAGIGLLGVAGGFLTAAALTGGSALGFNFFAPSAGIRALTFVRIVSRYGEKLVGHDVTLRIARDLRVWFFQGALPLAPAVLGRARMGELLARLMGDIDLVDGLLVRAIGPLLALGVMGLLACAVAAWLYLPAAALLGLLLLLLGVTVPLVVARGQQAAEGHHTQLLEDLRVRVYEGLAGAADLHAMQADDAWQAHVDAAIDALQGDQVRRQHRLAAGHLVHALTGALGLVAMLWLVLHGASTGAVDAPRAAALLFLSLGVLELAAGGAIAWQALLAGRAAWQRLTLLIAQEPPVQPRGTGLPAKRGDMRLHDVAFRWPGSSRPLLHGVNLQVPAGQRVLISGDSGSGKSTLVALLLRVIDPQAGGLHYGGTDLRALDLAAWHQRIAWLPQDAPVFAGSVRDNLLLASSQASESAQWEVLERVHLGHWARSREGLDTWVGESGAAMSVGQARRLVLAGVLLRDAALVVLDEPTSGLDVDTAHALLADLPAIMCGRSLVMISHDTLAHAVAQVHYRLSGGSLHLVPQIADDALA